MEPVWRRARRLEKNRHDSRTASADRAEPEEDGRPGNVPAGRQHEAVLAGGLSSAGRSGTGPGADRSPLGTARRQMTNRDHDIPLEWLVCPVTKESLTMR